MESYGLTINNEKLHYIIIYSNKKIVLMYLLKTFNYSLLFIKILLWGLGLLK